MRRSSFVAALGILLLIAALAAIRYGRQEKTFSVEQSTGNEMESGDSAPPFSENNEDGSGAVPVDALSEDPDVAPPKDATGPEKTETDDDQREAPKLLVVSRLTHWGFETVNNRVVDTIIVHTSYNSRAGKTYDTDKIAAIYREYEVSAHYLIDRGGTIYQLVKEKDIAYHAGESVMPDGRKGVNQFSIGIEILNSDDDSPTKEQYQALNALISNIKSRWNIKYVLGHSDIAPGRKTDPWGFDWKKVKK